MRSKIIRIVLYSLFFLACLVFFLFQGFPIKLIGERYIGNLQKSLGMKVTYASMDTLFPNGAEATGVRLQKIGDEGSVPITIRAERLAGRISLFSLIAGRMVISLSSDLLAGKLEGDFSQDDERWKLKAQLSGLNLAKLTFLSDLIGPELTGQVTGNLNFNVPNKDIKTAQGEISLQVVQGRFGNGKIYGLAVPWLSLGKTEINAVVQKGKLEIKAMKITSDDLEASVDGHLLLQQKFENISVHCRLRLKLADEKLEEIRKQLPPGMLDTQLAKAKGKDGYLRWIIFGRLGGRLQFKPLKQ